MRCAQFVRIQKSDQPPKETVDKLEIDLPSDTRDPEDSDTAMATSQPVPPPPAKTPAVACNNPATPLDVCPFDGCTWRFATPYKLRRHLMSHTKETPYTCKECDRGFSVRYNLLMHIQTIHSQPFRFKCPVRGCKEGYPTQPKLNSHLKKVHKRDGKTMDIKPEPSDAVLTNNSSNSVDSKRSHQCPECGKECGSPSKLATHIKTHSSDKPHKCTVQGCDKAFATKDRLTRHMETHKNTEQFPCPHPNCTRVFLRQSHLQSHLKTHNQESFACRVVDCNEKFSTESEYNEHLNSHMNFEHRCPYKDCGQTFSVFKRLDIHCKMAHHTTVEEARSQALKGTSWPTSPPPLVPVPPSTSPDHDHHHSDPELTYIKGMPSNCELPDLKLEDIDTVISDSPAWRDDQQQQQQQQQEGFVPHVTIKREPRVSMEYESDGGYYSSPSMQSTATSAPFSSHSISPVLTPVNLSPAIVSPCHCFFPPSHSFFHSPVPDTPSPRESFGFFRHPYGMVPSPLGTPDATTYSPTFPPSYYSSVFIPMSPYADSHTFSGHSSIPCTMNPAMVRDSAEYIDFLCPAPSSPKFPCSDPAPMIPPLIPDRQPKCEGDKRNACQAAAKGVCAPMTSEGCPLLLEEAEGCGIKTEASSPSIPNGIEGVASTPVLCTPTPIATPTCTEKDISTGHSLSPRPWYHQQDDDAHMQAGGLSPSGGRNLGTAPNSETNLIGCTQQSGGASPSLPSSVSQVHERKVYASILFTQPNPASIGGALSGLSRDSGNILSPKTRPQQDVKQVTPRKSSAGKGHKSHLNRTAKPSPHKSRHSYQWPKSINSANLVAFRDYILKKLKKEPGEGGASSSSPCSFHDVSSSSSHPQSPAHPDVLLGGSNGDSMLSSGSPCGCHESLVGGGDGGGSGGGGDGGSGRGSDCSSLCNEDSTLVQDMDCSGLMSDLRPSSLMSLPSAGFSGQDEIDTFLEDLESSRSVVGSPLSSENPGELYGSLIHSVEVDSDFEVTGGDLLTRNLHPHFGSLHEPEQDSMFEITESMGTFL
ncbi:hypothetical protein EMCRGX_G023513 [Ephydatia muelleri]